MFWPNIVNADRLIDTHCCRGLKRPSVLRCFRRPSPLPSLLCVRFFPSCCFSPFAPTTSFASEARRFHSVREGSGGLLDYPPPSHLPTLQRALFVSSAQARSRAQQASCLVLLAETGLVYQGGLLGQQHEGVIVTGHGQAKAASASLVSGSSS